MAAMCEAVREARRLAESLRRDLAGHSAEHDADFALLVDALSRVQAACPEAREVGDDVRALELSPEDCEDVSDEELEALFSEQEARAYLALPGAYRD
jgi:hypothetical protein